jgi:site-specific DNA recombinase
MNKQASSLGYFAYLRVSTTRQGQIGTSLAEQQTAIERYALDHKLEIINWFEERETAARSGRPVFRRMMKALHRQKASGVIIYKIDRSARNLKDWAEIGELIDTGIEVHFANENLNLYSRGGRLSADIQAVVAADFIRNLREETKKGFYGRIKQGFYPMPAPLGYLDTGGGKAKAIDPVKAPFIKALFELYATEHYGLRSLAAEMKIRGLRGRRGQVISGNGFSKILHNLFYIGVIRVKTTGEYHVGKHTPIIQKELFDRVQKVLQSKTTYHNPSASLVEAFLFRKLLICKRCSKNLIGERQKVYFYYRCHTITCPQKTIRTEIVEQAFCKMLENLRYGKNETTRFEARMKERFRQLGKRVLEERMKLRSKLEHVQSSLLHLADNLIKGTIDERLFVQMKNKLVDEEIVIQHNLDSVAKTERESLQKMQDAFRFAQTASIEYEQADYLQKRNIIKVITQEILVEQKSVIITLHPSFDIVSHRLFS